MIKENLAYVENEIQEACRRAGRAREEVTLIAVSKTKPVSDLKEAYALGIRVFGENKVQELVDKYEVLPKDIRWHMIGHLQRNKVKYIIDKVDLIHSVDSVRLAETIEKEAAKHEIVVNILIEVNVAREESKFGLMPEDLDDFIRQTAGFTHIRIKGLMTIAPFVENAEENRPIFERLRKLSVDMRGENVDNNTVCILSMGMTNDYCVAIEEGATMIRVGTGIFGARDYSLPGEVR
ncbi:MAG: YggS family pyridoxal phosphate-dependent enzyme [Lachnospiraceae bacterium]